MTRDPFTIINKRTRQASGQELPAAVRIAAFNAGLAPSDIKWFTVSYDTVTLATHTLSEILVPRLMGPNSFLFSNAQEHTIYQAIRQSHTTPPIYYATIINPTTVLLHASTPRPATTYHIIAADQPTEPTNTLEPTKETEHANSQ